MVKQALYTYWKSLHPRNYKKARRKIDVLDAAWLFFMINGIHDIEIILFYLIKILPLLIMLWSNMVTKLSMPKAMFLMPMTVSDRKKYINTLAVIKIGVPTVLGILLQMIHGWFYELHLLGCIPSAFAQISMGIGIYVCSEMRGKFDRYIRYAVRGKDGIGKVAWLNWICMIVSFFLGIGFSFVDFQGSFSQKLFVAGGMLVLLVMDIAIIKTRYENTIESICNYENTFDVLGKVKSC